METSKKEVRYGEIRAAQDPQQEEERLVEGYAVVFEKPTIIWSDGETDFKEVVDRNALVDADISDVPFKYNHSDAVMIMARTRNKTLELTVDNNGLKFSAQLADTTMGNDLHKLVKRGDIDKMSYAYTVSEDSYDRETHTRRILKIKKLYDVSAVDLPAYDDTSISARDYFKSMLDGEKQAQEEQRQVQMNIMKRRLDLAEKL